MFYVLEMVDGMRRVLLCLLEAVEGKPYLLEVPNVIRCLPLCTLEAVEGELCLLEVLKLPEVMRCVILCMLEAMRALALFAGGVGCAGGDALCAAMHTGGCRGWALFAGDIWRCRRCRSVCAVCCSVCWRQWRVGSVCWRCRR